jgi:Spy/CpxP family protein refolding chaperone
MYILNALYLKGGGPMLKALLTVCLMVVFAAPAFSDMDMHKGEHKEMHHKHMEMCKCKMECPGDMMEGMMGMCHEHAKEIGLTEDQITKITPIHREMEKKAIRLQADLKIAEIDLKEIMEVKDFDLEKASAQVKKIEDIKTALHLEMLKSMKDIRSILTDEQFKKMKEMMHMKMKECETREPHKKMLKKKK